MGSLLFHSSYVKFIFYVVTLIDVFYNIDWRGGHRWPTNNAFSIVSMCLADNALNIKLNNKIVKICNPAR